ncbi:MAG: transcription termination factor NusA, partial [Dehalococcoidia bacterium]
IVYEEFTNREGEVVTGVIQYMEPRRIYVRLNRTEGVLPLEEQVPTEHYHRGQRLKFYLLQILEGGRGPQIVVSRSHPHLVRRLFELEIPEVHSGLVELKAIAREAGHRTKVAVASSQDKVDPVGCCLGPRGIRLQSIINELKGEKIDVIQWHSNPGIFIANALGPAQVAGTRIDEERRAATVVVPDKQLSLAIGKEGQNARLAAKLTGWRFDIRSVSAVEAEKALVEEPEPVEEEAIPELAADDIFEEKRIEEEPVEEVIVEEPIDFAKLMEASTETKEEGQIRFAEEILRSSAKSDTSDRAKSAAKGKAKGPKYKKKTEGFWSEELDD